MIGEYAGLCGISQTCPSTFLSVFTVASLTNRSRSRSAEFELRSVPDHEVVVIE